MAGTVVYCENTVSVRISREDILYGTNLVGSAVQVVYWQTVGGVNARGGEGVLTLVHFIVVTPILVVILVVTLVLGPGERGSDM